MHLAARLLVSAFAWVGLAARQEWLGEGQGARHGRRASHASPRDQYPRFCAPWRAVDGQPSACRRRRSETRLSKSANLLIKRLKDSERSDDLF